jgi:hypothetical protein
MGVLLLCIVAYNLLKDRVPVCGPVLMAGCRMLAVWLGAGGALRISPELGTALGVWGGFVLGVTLLARLETTDLAPGLPVYALAGWIAAAPWFLWCNLTMILLVPTVGLHVFLAVSAFRLARNIHRRGQVIPPDIGQWLKLLFPLQAVVLFGCGAGLAACVVLCLWLLLGGISRRIAMS